MGAFFTNVHVLAQAGRAVEAQAAILECLRAMASEGGLLPCEDDAKADRAFIVRRNGAWVAVYDQATESQDVGLLDRLATRLSASVGRPAIAMLVSDSDHLLLRLFEEGRLSDAVEGGKATGSIEAWSRVVGPEKAQALGASFAKRDLFSEHTLADAAATLGMDADYACTGYRYLVEQGSLPDGAIHLRFRHAVRPTYERPADGPPKLAGISLVTPLTLAVDGVLRVQAMLQNRGGAGRSFYVVVHGPAIDAGLVEPKTVKVVTGLDPRRGGAVLDAPAERKALPSGRPCFVADFPEGEIPPSNAGGVEALRELDVKERVELHMKAQILTVVEGRAVAEGTGDLVVSLVCREAREHPGRQPFNVTVAPTPRRPLRGKSDDPSHYLGLASSEALVALAASTLPKAEAAPITAEILEKWSQLWPRGIALDVTFFVPDEPARPKKPGSATLKIDGIPKSATWKKVCDGLRDANCVVGSRPREGTPREMSAATMGSRLADRSVVRSSRRPGARAGTCRRSAWC